MSLEASDHPQARAEWLEALAYYNTAGGAKLADKYADATEAALGFIAEAPLTPRRYPGIDQTPYVRHWHVNGFPYRIVYQPRPSGIWILAYAHTSRRPGYWADRLNDTPPGETNESVDTEQT